jgi:hypothetical protein
MKLYIATLLCHNEYGIDHAKTFIAHDPDGLACQVYDWLSDGVDDEENPYDFTSILIECTNGNEGGEPLSMGVDTDLCHEYLLTTKITEI